MQPTLHALPRPVSGPVLFVSADSPEASLKPKRSSLFRQVSMSGPSAQLAGEGRESPRSTPPRLFSDRPERLLGEEPVVPSSSSSTFSRVRRRVQKPWTGSKRDTAADPGNNNSELDSDQTNDDTDDGLSSGVNDGQKQTFLDHGIRYFNLNPVKGLKFLLDKRVIRDRDVPEFLKSTRGLNKVQVVGVR
jgi:hypothetical protein